MKINKVLIPAAGFGTRFLPFTKAVPKEMVPLLNKPAIHYVVQEACDALADTCVIITNKDKPSLEHYFEENAALDRVLQASHDKQQLLDPVKDLMRSMAFTYVYQEEQKGLGHAVWSARHGAHDDYFGITLPDEIIFTDIPALSQLMEIAKREHTTVIGVQEVAADTVSSYGIIGIDKKLDSETFIVASLVEKPAIDKAPSQLAIIGRYIVSPEIFKHLDDRVTNTTSGEIQLTDALSDLLASGHKIIAHTIQGTRYDIGTPTGWLKATMALAANDPAYASIVNSKHQK